MHEFLLRGLHMCANPGRRRILAPEAYHRYVEEPTTSEVSNPQPEGVLAGQLQVGAETLCIVRVKDSLTQPG